MSERRRVAVIAEQFNIKGATVAAIYAAAALGMAMTRREFGRPVKRAALERSQGVCEAVGERYGQNAGARCQTPIAWG